MGGVKESYGKLKKEVRRQFGVTLAKTGCMGISAMMHGYLVFDGQGKLLAPFKTWRNGVPKETGPCPDPLSWLHIPQRWSGAHLYQAALDGADYLGKIDYMTTLSGYIHWKLTGRRCWGLRRLRHVPGGGWRIPLHQQMAEKLEALLKPYGLTQKLEDIFPQVLLAGEETQEA